MLFQIFLLVAVPVLYAAAVPAQRATGPTVQLDNATFVGTTSDGVSKFLGIPFAKPPTGNRRFRLPEANDPYTGTYTVQEFGPSCPQQAVDLPLPEGLVDDAVDFIVNSIFQLVLPDNEDCLTINVVKPSGATSTSNLPVVAWIFGGGFELGSPSMYDGGIIVSRSIALGQPVVYVSMNYRLNGFGFLASQEVKAAGVGNLGLQDQRQALRWVQNYIRAFGGDPTKVTIWGESAGAISASLQMLANGGNAEGLFRGAFMQSGSPIPVGDISHGQVYYDALVRQTGCSGASDTLQCLRGVSYSILKAAIGSSPGIFDYQSLNLAWLPRTDGVFLTDTPQRLVLQGSVANIPFVTGDCDDEGTLFSLSNLNVTTNAEFRQYASTVLLPYLPVDLVDELMDHYPQDITQGSPYDTWIFNALTPQSKRIASVLGDAVFQAPRRFFLEQRASQQRTWSFLNKRLKALPVLGSAHATDILNVYLNGDLTDYLLNFVANLDPNVGSGGGINWPQYSTSSPRLLTLLDGLISQTISQDTFRREAIDWLIDALVDYPI